ncbi:uncharacterized protein LOC131248211 [Magnolia sinica]|uniref:uncharacterized protein LOC131248211 n=1 Tax=Magnolia sinica TaxID=86752 RepID=UPI002658CC14|nr:uncharacterized protein LOC131248211 [Magnolia sinica]
MGMAMSYVNKGMPSAQLLPMKVLTDKLKAILSDQNFESFEQFHIGVLEIVAKFNSGMPGIRYDAPNLKAVQKCYIGWKKATEEEKMKKLEELFTMTSPDRTATIVTGIVAPPAAMIVKRTAEMVPNLNMIKMVPDAVFVPSASLVVLTLVRFFQKNALQDHEIKSSKAESLMNST